MASLPNAEVQSGYNRMRSLTWSREEKVIARKAFDAALRRELAGVIAKVKKMAAKIEQPSELWDLEFYLSKRRQEIDRRYDYRYSVLIFVFAELIRTGPAARGRVARVGTGEDRFHSRACAAVILSL